MGKYERKQEKLTGLKGFTGNLCGIENSEKLRRKLSEPKPVQGEDRAGFPVSFVSPYAGSGQGCKKGQKTDKKDKNNITLLEVNTQRGKQELELDLDNKKVSYISTAKRNIDGKGLREDMRYIDPDTAKKQRKTGDYNLLLAAGKKDGAADMELPRQRNWTDSVVSKLGGDNRSEMMSYLCPYANTERDQKELSLARQKLVNIKKAIMESKPDKSNKSDMSELRLQEREVQSSIEELANRQRKKNYQKAILTQKLKYATNPTLKKDFYNRFKGGAGFQATGNKYEKEDTAIDEKSDDESGIVDLDQELKGDGEE